VGVSGQWVATLLIVAPLTVTTIQTVRRQNILDRAEAIALEWAADSNTHVVRTDFEGEDLILYVEDLDDLPPGDLAAALADAAGCFTPQTISGSGWFPDDPG